MSADRIAVLAVVTVFAVVVCTIQVRRALRKTDRIIASIAYDPAAGRRETAPGTDAALLDEIELIASLPVYEAPDVEEGFDRLRQAIRDEQQKGGTA